MGAWIEMYLVNREPRWLGSRTHMGAWIEYSVTSFNIEPLSGRTYGCVD